MFSLIKRIQDLLKKIRNNRGLLFTSLSIISILGILIFMYFIMTMTSSIKDDVYESLKNNNNRSMDNLFDSRKKEYLKITNTILQDISIITHMRDFDKESISLYEDKFNELYSKNIKYPLIIKFYSQLNTQDTFRNTIINLMRTKSQSFGIEIQDDAVYLSLIEPVLDAGRFIGLMETKQSIHSLKEFYEKEDSFLIFMLDKKMLVKLSLKSKHGKFSNIVSDYTIKQGNYSSRFYSKMKDMKEKDFEVALENSYDSDDKFYRSYKTATDINGADIGLFVFGEFTEKNDGFVNLVEKMIKSVTFVSLGLVISILLFMF